MLPLPTRVRRVSGYILWRPVVASEYGKDKQAYSNITMKQIDEEMQRNQKIDLSACQSLRICISRRIPYLQPRLLDNAPPITGPMHGPNYNSSQ